MEEWRDIKYKNGYQISDCGNVRSYVNNRHGLTDIPHYLKPQANKNGYLTVYLGRGCRKLISKLVAEAFIPNPNNYPLVRHMDDNPLNNHVTNLAWGTQKHNMEDCVAHGRLVGDTRAAIESRKKRVIAIRRDGSRRLEFESLNEAARVLNVWPQHISSVLKGKLSQTGGWKFIYPEDGDSSV